jgi:hypothetical protein
MWSANIRSSTDGRKEVLGTGVNQISSQAVYFSVLSRFSFHDSKPTF